MKLLGKLLTLLVAIEHVYIMILEMFLWTKPIALKTFGFTQEFAETTQVLAQNQGLYNGFLAAGLLWSLLLRDKNMSHKVGVFFLSCVVVAGIFGGLTAKLSIIVTQGLPALLALIVTLWAKR